MSSKNPGRTQFLLMMGIVVLTLGGSYLLFYFSQNGNVWNTTNEGEFVENKTLDDLQLLTNQGVPVTPAGLWSLLIVAANECGADCATSLSQMRALQVLITKDATRIRRALLIANGTISAEIAATYPKLMRLQANQQAGAELAPGIYIVDPAGVFVLRFELGDTGAKVQKDLKRLLKYSRIG